MGIDASIPYRAGTAGQFSLADIAQQSQALRLNERTADQRDRQLDMRGQQFDLEMQEHLGKLDADKKAAVAKGLEDIAAAVQWAGNDPQRWATVQQHYAAQFPDIASVPVERAQEVLVMTGKMADYLKATEPKIMGVEAGGSLAAVDPRTLKMTPLVIPNPGDQPAFSSAGAGGPQAGAVVNGYRFRGGNPNDRNAWEPVVGGGVSNGTGTFRP